MPPDPRRARRGRLRFLPNVIHYPYHVLGWVLMLLYAGFCSAYLVGFNATGGLCAGSQWYVVPVVNGNVKRFGQETPKFRSRSPLSARAAVKPDLPLPRACID